MLVLLGSLTLLLQVLRQGEELRLAHQALVEASIDAMQTPLILPEDDVHHDPEDGDEPDDEDPSRGLERIAILAQDRPHDP